MKTVKRWFVVGFLATCWGDGGVFAGFDNGAQVNSAQVSEEQRAQGLELCRKLNALRVVDINTIRTGAYQISPKGVLIFNPYEKEAVGYTVREGSVWSRDIEPHLQKNPDTERFADLKLAEVNFDKCWLWNDTEKYAAFISAKDLGVSDPKNFSLTHEIIESFITETKDKPQKFSQYMVPWENKRQLRASPPSPESFFSFGLSENQTSSLTVDQGVQICEELWSCETISVDSIRTSSTEYGKGGVIFNPFQLNGSSYSHEGTVWSRFVWPYLKKNPDTGRFDDLKLSEINVQDCWVWGYGRWDHDKQNYAQRMDGFKDIILTHEMIEEFTRQKVKKSLNPKSNNATDSLSIELSHLPLQDKYFMREGTESYDSAIGRIASLELKDCGLKKVLGFFKHLSPDCLSYIEMSDNKIKSIAAEEFPVLRYVHELHLERNNLESVVLNFDLQSRSSVWLNIHLEGNPELPQRQVENLSEAILRSAPKDGKHNSHTITHDKISLFVQQTAPFKPHHPNPIKEGEENQWVVAPISETHQLGVKVQK